MARRPKHDLGDLVPISHARLRTWLARRGLSANEVARRAGILPQKLSLLITGRVVRCRRKDRQELARVLGVSVAFLSGDPAAEPPGGGVTREMIAPVLAGEVARRRRPGDRATGADLPVETLFQSEHLALLAELERVFPAEADRGHEQVLVQGTGAGSAPRTREISASRAFGAAFALDLHVLQCLIAGRDDFPAPSQPLADHFTGQLNTVMRMLLDPWLTYQQDRQPVPPGGTRLVAALASVATELIQATLMGEVQPREVVDGVVGELEQIAHRLNEIQHASKMRRLGMVRIAEP